MASILGFAACVGGTYHPAAIFKFSGKDGYCWWAGWPSDGCLVSVWPTRKAFLRVTEHHSSYHQDGRRHQAVNEDHINGCADCPIFDVVAWASLRSITVPLDSWFPWKMDAKPWSDVECPNILRREDFGGAGGVNLHGFICRQDRVDDLTARWRLVATKHWLAGDDNLRLVVLAERI